MIVTDLDLAIARSRASAQPAALTCVRPGIFRQSKRALDKIKKGAPSRVAPFFQPGFLVSEIKPDLCDLLNRLAVELGWFELILHNRLKSCVFEYGRAADEFGIGDLAVFADFHFHHHGAIYVAGLGDWGIVQGRSLN